MQDKKKPYLCPAWKQFYDDDDEPVNAMNAYDIKSYGNRKAASRAEIIPPDKPNRKTMMVIEKYDFDILMDDSFFYNKICKE